MRFSTLSVTLFAVLATACLIPALFPPAVKENLPVSGRAPGAQEVAIFAVIASGYATVNGGADRIRAVSKPAREWVANGLLAKIYPALTRIPVIGNTVVPDPEEVLRLSPDAVFVYARDADVLRKTGSARLIEILVDPKHPIESREKVWREMGKVAGKSARVAALLNRWATKRAALKTTLPQDAARQVRVMWVHTYMGKWSTTNSEGHIAHKLELAGGQNVTRDFKFTGWGDVEQLLLADPGIILFGFYPDDHTTMRQITDRPEFRPLRAVREGRIYRLPADTFMNEPVEDPLLLMWMAEVFYPDIMPRRLREEYKETYREVYHYAISDDEIDKAIYLEENRLSAGYDRFAR